VAEALCMNTMLTSLDIGDNRLELGGGQALAEILLVHPLRSLVVICNDATSRRRYRRWRYLYL
jgi:hypothetical protein